MLVFAHLTPAWQIEWKCEADLTPDVQIGQTKERIPIHTFPITPPPSPARRAHSFSTAMQMGCVADTAVGAQLGLEAGGALAGDLARVEGEGLIQSQ